MILRNEFLVDAPVDVVWRMLDDMETIVPCMPGASYMGREGHDHQVGIRMKVGAISTHFQGVVRFVEKDASKHTAVIRGSGKDAGGKASASATLVATLEPQPTGGTRVVVKTDMAITGRLAQFGGGVLADISSRLILQFADNLQRSILARSSAPMPSYETDPSAIMSSEAGAGSVPAQEPPALDLGGVVGPVALNLVRRFVAVPVAFFVLGWLAARYL